MVEEQAVLAVDVGGSRVKVLVSGELDRRRGPSGPTLTPSQMVTTAIGLAEGWRWDVVSVGVPAPVHRGSVVVEPFNLGRGWVGFKFQGRSSTSQGHECPASRNLAGGLVSGSS